MGKSVMIINPNNRRKDRNHKIRSNTKRKQSDSGKRETVVIVSITPDEQLKTFFKSNEEKFPAAVEALKGKFIGFEKMTLDQMIERINQFIRTMAFGLEIQKSKNVAFIQQQLIPILVRAELALQDIAW